MVDKKNIEKVVLQEFRFFYGEEKDLEKILQTRPNDFDMEPADSVEELMDAFDLKDDDDKPYNKYHEDLSGALYCATLGEMVDIVYDELNNKK